MLKLLGIVLILLCLSMVSAKSKKHRKQGIGQHCKKEQPCKNGGTRGNTRRGYICKCPPGWQGDNCEQAVDACADSPCNQGTCVNTAGSYTCTCPPGWTGTNCQTDIDECSTGSHCNGGQCVNVPGSFICKCAQGLTGETCQTDIDECTNNPCMNEGTCVNLIGSYSCNCRDGWTGSNCETDVDECFPLTSPCSTNDHCINTPGSYKCLCRADLEEPFCEAATSRVFLCEDGKMMLRCSEGTINIRSANYGRSETGICPLQGKDQNIECDLATAGRRVRELCQGKKKCHLQATNTFFGSDPCQGTYKYLVVRYRCIV
uniref:Neurogenic locus notch homolog protein 2-like n=1 Tax=Crassostrea virginica TaxID=6565 RepID=A0A8B8C753_CRAVI|nr:neurogenic locus notch homolog protein 2-like [Crassostrea virginica]